MATEQTAVRLLLSNPSSIFLDCSELLLRYAENIIRNPQEPKFRTIRLENQVVRSRLVPIPGALDCLKAMGFTQREEKLVLLPDTPLDDVIKIRDQITVERLKKLSPAQQNAQAAETSAQATSQPGGAAREPAASAVTEMSSVPAQTTPQSQVVQPSNNILASERQFYARLESSFQHVLLYEDPVLQAKARSLIPEEELRAKAQEKLKVLEELEKEETKTDNSPPPLTLEDLILPELRRWFKKDFFKWVDKAPCDGCGGRTTAAGMANPTPAEQMWQAGRVELYHCATCQRQTRFPRYNHPGKLLETRRGRCGEWANCFTLLCRSLGYEARHVVDWTDHCWTECYSTSQQRWLHLDGEKYYDKPLVYEAGWKKKLTYIIAYSKDEIRDVTWRYSCRHQEVCARRKECRESWLRETVTRMNEKRQAGLSQERKDELVRRFLVELVEFISPRRPGEKEMGGRTTGSVAWRLARGELGTQKDKSKAEPHVFRLSEQEKKGRLFHLVYCTANDKYTRLYNNVDMKVGWQNWAHTVQDVFRKEEHDWNMCYLARTEGATTGSVSWKLDLSGSGLCVQEIKVVARSQTFENGSISWQLCSGDKCILLNGDAEGTKTRDLEGVTSFTLTADLRGGRGDHAWQHAQLFRQALDRMEEFPLDIQVHLKPL
ncbi:peptide-N(4)-(N-acetyl-beta-glucosaminyl)asparagine amidase-like [Branchiostoma lanceolatum]|uniref:peptide-N(4)-(N-acetyl-beta- glucosaminyl)asparagine amidase-like n=1 Tax=Branchiostoma lanceolatum TaxID=7740 RepID=UPI00345112DB